MLITSIISAAACGGLVLTPFAIAILLHRRRLLHQAQQVLDRANSTAIDRLREARHEAELLVDNAERQARRTTTEAEQRVARLRARGRRLLDDIRAVQTDVPLAAGRSARSRPAAPNSRPPASSQLPASARRGRASSTRFLPVT